MTRSTKTSKLAAWALICTLLVTVATGCFTMNHQVGNGASGGAPMAQRQWYAVWGLVPLNAVSSHQMAGGASDYNIETEWTPMDIVINIFTGWITVYSRTVTVTK